MAFLVRVVLQLYFGFRVSGEIITSNVHFDCIIFHYKYFKHGIFGL